MGIAVIFPGQGTQSPGMGAVWRDHEAWSVVERAEAALGEPLGHLLLAAPAESLTRTRDAQLAVLLTSLVAWEAVRGLLPAPVAMAGHSLGQVTALTASGVLGLEDGVRFAARRAELTQREADRHPGRMVALLGATVDQAREACEAAPGACWLANDNAPGQVVIAGTPEGVEAATARAKEIGVRRAAALNVGGAFHTPLMADAAADLADALTGTTVSPPCCPVVANADGVAHADADGWRRRLAEHVRSPVRWRESVEVLVAGGADRLYEVGHGSMLAGLAKRIVPDVPVVSVSSPADLPALSEVH